MTDILALDIATTTGWARGKAEAYCEGCGWIEPIEQIQKRGAISCCPERNIIWRRPQSGVITFGKSGSSNNAVFYNCLQWISKLLEPEPRPHILYLEDMLPPT